MSYNGIMLKLLAATLFLSSCATISHIEPVTRSEVTQRRAAVTLQVLCGGEDPLGRAGWGSGVIISEQHVLTAAHVVECPFLPTIRVTLSNGHKLRMVVVDEDKENDIAKLEILSDELFNHVIKPPKLAMFEYVDLGQKVCAETGFPERKRVCGNAVTPTRARMTLWQGASGSAVYDPAGRLVGLVVRSVNYTNGTASDTRFAPIDRKWLKGT
jgi:S1-C subfamily serine protease